MKKPKPKNTVYAWKSTDGMGLPVEIDFELGWWAVAKGVDFRKAVGGVLMNEWTIYHTKFGRCAPFYFPKKETAIEACRMIHGLKEDWDVPLSEFDKSRVVLAPFIEKYKKYRRAPGASSE